MTDYQLNRAVAEATGESVSTIAAMGFVPLTPMPNEREPLVADWDAIQQSRRVSLQSRRRRAPRVV